MTSLLVALALVAQPSAAGDDAIVKLLTPIREQHQLPGLAGALIIGDELVASGAVGVRKLGSEEPLQADDLFHIGSCTKAMTATLLAMLVEEEKLSWDSTVGEVFRTQRGAIHEQCRDITLEQLLTHRSGLRPNGDWWSLQQAYERDDKHPRRVGLVGRLLSPAPKHEPGTTFEYSNLGYVIAGAMAEQVTGKSWEELMRARLFEPLGMKTAGFGPPGTKSKLDQPWGHSFQDGTYTPTQMDNPPVMGPAGCCHMTLADWGKFVSMHLRGAHGTESLLTEATFSRLHTAPEEEPYAYGWLVVDRPWAGGAALTHAGSNTVWYCIVWIAPEQNFAVLAATNAGGGVPPAQACDDVSAALIGYREKHSRGVTPKD